MEGLVVVVHQITAYVPILDTRLDEIDQTTQQISNFTFRLNTRLEDVEGTFRSCDAQVGEILKALAKHEYLILR